MVLGAPSAGPLTTPSCGVQSTCWREGKGCHPEGPWQAWEVGLGKPHGVQHHQEKVLHLGQDKHKYRLASPGEKDSGRKSSVWLSNVPSQPRKPIMSWDASKAAWPAGHRRWCCPSTLLFLDPTCTPVCPAPIQERQGSFGKSPEEATKLITGLDHWISYRDRLKECSAWRREGSWGDLWAAFQYLKKA